MARRPPADPPPDDRSSDGIGADSTFDVLERARHGDSKASLVLLERTVAPLRQWARGRMPPFARGTADTEDIVQDVVVRALSGLKRFEHRTVDALQHYLRESVRNRIKDEIRRVMRRGVAEPIPDDVVDDEHSPIEQLILKEGTERYVKALRTLKPDDRLAVIYRLEHKYRFDEIARRVGKASPDAARVAVARAMRRLAAELGLIETAKRSAASGAGGPGAAGRAKKAP